MARVQNLFSAPRKHFPMEELSEVRALDDAGFEGCAHARPASKRQVLLMDRETLEAMDLRPGVIRENITTDGLNANGLQIGQLLRVGEARRRICTRLPAISVFEIETSSDARVPFVNLPEKRRSRFGEELITSPSRGFEV